MRLSYRRLSAREVSDRATFPMGSHCTAAQTDSVVYQAFRVPKDFSEHFQEPGCRAGGLRRMKFPKVVQPSLCFGHNLTTNSGSAPGVFALLQFYQQKAFPDVSKVTIAFYTALSTDNHGREFILNIANNSALTSGRSAYVFSLLWICARQNTGTGILAGPLRRARIQFKMRAMTPRPQIWQRTAQPSPPIPITSSRSTFKQSTRRTPLITTPVDPS